jgi:hypothetical protein
MEDLMKLLELKSAYNNTEPAVVQQNPGEHYTDFIVEPGDATRYTVQLFEGGKWSTASVGMDPMYEKSRGRLAIVVKLEDTAIVMSHPVGGNSYQEEILVYLATLALDVDCKEPDGLKERREMSNKHKEE